MDPEPDTCRICSAPAEPDAPLFHPCKCSGTIKYIHQECLKTWLEHSKKRRCDVCHYPYAFTKVYSPQMPQRIPVHLYIRRLLIQSFQAVRLVLRASLVSFVWLIALPYATVVCWRFLFYIGEHTAWWILHRPRPQSIPSPDPFYPTLVYMMNLTIMDLSPSGSILNGNLSVETVETLVRSLSSDIFTGQIIASLIFVSFIVIFLLREYILQHVQPDALDDAAPPEPEPAPAEPPQAPAPLLPHLPFQPGEQPRTDYTDYTSREVSVEEFIRIEEARTGRKISLGGLTVPDRAEAEKRYIEEVRKRKRSSHLQPYSPDVDLSDGSPGPSKRPRETGDSPSSATQSLFTLDTSSTPNDVSGDLIPWPDFSKPTTPTRVRLRPSPGYPTTRTLSDRGPGSSLSNTRSLAAQPIQTEGPRDSTRPISDAFGTEESGTEPDPTLPSHLTFDDLPAPRPWTPSTNGPLTALPYPLTLSASPVDGTMVGAELTQPVLPREEASSAPLFLDSLAMNNTTMQAPFKTPKRPGLPLSPTLTPTEIGPSRVAIYRPPEQLGTPEDDGHLDYFSPALARDKDYADVAVQHPPDDEVIPLEFDTEELNELSDEESTISAEAAEEAEEAFRLFEEEAPNAQALAAREESDSENEEDPIRILEPGERDPPALEHVPAQQQRDAELNPDFEEDMDDILAAVGMRGPIRVLGQHAALMMFILNLSICVGILMPYVIGKSVALMSLDPSRIWELLNYPILAVRFVTDPIVDFVIFGISRGVLTIAEPYLGKRTTAKLAVSSQSGSLSPFPTNSTLLSLRPLKKIASTGRLGVLALCSRVPQLDAAVSRLQNQSTVIWQNTYSKYTSFAFGNTASDRALSILLGYSIVLSMAAVYLYMTSSGQLENAARVVRRVLKQQLIVFKVIGFMTVELIVFPLFCGMILDMSTLGVFKSVTVQSRWAFVCFAPVTTGLYYWLVGTIYMFHFAVTLSMCRGVMRPGAMWFIKDPQDPHFQPVRDILERRTIAQLQKLGLSALMYGIIIAGGFGIASWSLRWISFGGTPVLPLRWFPRKSLADYPFELMYMHLVAPYFLRYFKPRRTGRRIIRIGWRLLAKNLRLSAYMFGGKFPKEENTYPSWFSREGGKFEGGFRRVPNRDGIAVIKDNPVVIETNRDGVALTQKGRDLIEAQNAECVKAKREIQKDFVIVYVPPHFRLRLFLFVCGMSVFGILALIVAIGVPVPLGRHVFSLFTSEEVHDGYSFIAGCSMIWTCFSIGKALNECVNRRLIDIYAPSLDSILNPSQKKAARASWPLFLLKEGIRWAGQVTWLVCWIGFVIPILIAIVVDLYLVFPLRHMYDRGFEMKIDLPLAWLTGILYMMIALKVVKRQPGQRHRLMVEIDRMRRLRIGEQDVLRVTYRVIVPLVTGLVGMIVIPPLACYCLCAVLERYTGINGIKMAGNRFIFEFTYPMVFIMASLTRSVENCATLAASWSQIIRDNEFLLEMRLKNIDQNTEVDPPEV